MKSSVVPSRVCLESAPDASGRAPYADSDPFPLSYSQLPFWFFQQCQPGSAVYNLPFPVRLRGHLDMEKLAASMDDIRRRHEALQSLFVATGDQPLQRLHVDQRIPMPFVDLTQLPMADREAEACRLAAVEAQQPFDLVCGPLLRTTLIKLADDDHLLLRTVHHTVADGWSIALLRRELAAFYNARVRRNPPPLAPVASFRSLITAQQQRLRSETLETHLAWWKRQLAGELPRLSLPLDRSCPARRNFAGARVAVSLDAGLTSALRRLGRAQRTTLFVTLLAAFKVLLSRYCGQEDLLVASPVAGRLRPETRNVIAPFINTLLFRTDLSGDPPFVDLLDRVRDVALGAFAHQEVPFEMVLAELQSRRDDLDHSLVQAMLVLEPPQDEADLDGLTRTALTIDTGTSRFDLTLQLIEHANGLNGFYEYSTELFDRATIERMAGSFHVLLEAIVANPQRSISQLPLMRAQEQRRILASQDSRRKEVPIESCVHELISAQASRTPDATAIECGPRKLTYGELNRQVNQLACHLRQRGVERETLVGVCVERSVEMVVGLLAVLKAGGAYLPLDPHHPPRRLEFMMKDSGAAMLLTQSSLLRPVVAGGTPVVCIDQLTVETCSDHIPSGGTTADDLAYVIYTSGSTGQPKGVEIPHRALTNLLCSMRREPGLSAEDVLLAVTTLSFDIAALELFLPLIAGGRVVVVDENVARDGVQLACAARQSGATVMQATPSRWRVILEARSFPRGLKILCGGEPMTRELADQLLTLSASVWNLYGPTETTIWSTCCRVERTGVVSIGRTIDNTAAYVLDKNRQPVPVGVVGELYLAGFGVACGYRGRPELTGERFLPNPFAGGTMARIYRTGDLARLRADGSLECLGRIDQQLKMRGVRVDAGEIEATLCTNPGVRQAAVVARTDSAGEQQLIAYVVAAEISAADESLLHDHLRQLLPRDMIPARIVTVDGLPLTPNGKVDRQALPEPGPAVNSAPSTGHRPESLIERQLARFWDELLRNEVTNIDDHFFERGGHSLLAARLASRIRATWNIDLPLRTLFDAPTLRQQAACIEALLRERQQPERQPALCREARNRPIPASPGQRQIWLHEQLEPGGPLYHISWAARLRGPLDVALIERALNRVIARQDSLRTTFRAIDGEPFQQVAPHLTLPLQIDDLSHLPAGERGDEATRRTRAEHRRPFCLERGPLIRASFLRLDLEDGLLLITLHHLIADDWSLGVLQRELTLAWSQLSAGSSSGADELPLQFSDWTLSSRAQLTEERRDSLLKYWRQKLSTAPLRLELPADGPRITAPARRGESCGLRLSHDLTAALQALSRDRSATLFMTLLAAWQVLLSRLSGHTDLVVGAPVACRQTETEGLIGFFVNTVPLRGDLTGNPTFSELLDRVRETVLDAFAHQDLPFEKLVESLQPEERPQHGTPLFQVLLNMLNANEHTLQLPDVAVELLPPPELYAKFDLTLYARCRGDALHLLLVYDAEQFHHRRIEEMLGQLERLLIAVSQNPAVRVEHISLVTNSAQRILPDAAAPLASPWCPVIHEWFRRQAVRVPQQFAVEDSRLRWTYSELDYLSDRLARRLRSAGVNSGDVVAVLGDRSAPLVWALLGILKAGAAFSILDPQFPATRLEGCLSAARAVGLVHITGAGESDTRAAITFDSPKLRVRVCLPRDPQSIRHWLDRAAGGDDSLPDVEVDDAACVAFTSGTTGAPKAILSTHRPLSHFLQWQISQFELDARDRFGFLSGLSHDPALRDVFTPLASGGTLVIPDPDEIVAGRLGHWLQRAGVSVIHITPAVSELVSREEGLLSGLRYVFFGGDALARNTVEAMRRAAPRAALVNFYGATETPQAAAWYRVPGLSSVPVSRAECDRIPIGHGIRGTQLLVRNGAGALCGIGEPGEIHVRTPHLARGYLNEAPLTAARFVPNSSTGGRDDRVYKTGDLGRYLLDGAVECLGRNDEQINLRGVRIEPGEVVAAIRRHAAVRDVVVALDDARQLLVAWVLTAESHVLDRHELRRFLLGQLPLSIIPSRFHFVDRFPLTLNGKIDRQKLLAASDELEAKSHSRTECHEEFELTPTGRRIAHIWQNELQVHRVGPHDTFVDLGGHSLLAMHVMARIERELQVQITPQELLFQPLVQLAAVCDERILDSWLRSRSTFVHQARRLLSMLCRPWRATSQ